MRQILSTFREALHAEAYPSDALEWLCAAIWFGCAAVICLAMM